MPRDDATLLDIVLAAKRLIDITNRTNRRAFEQDQTQQLAVLHLLMIAGEAANRLSNETRLRFPTMRWRQLIALRNIIVHRYDDIDLDEIWSVRHAQAALTTGSNRGFK